jgi:hypothetical protein
VEDLESEVALEVIEVPIVMEECVIGFDTVRRD